MRHDYNLKKLILPKDASVNMCDITADPGAIQPTFTTTFSAPKAYWQEVREDQVVEYLTSTLHNDVVWC